MYSTESEREQLWAPDAQRCANTRLAAFMAWVNRKYGLALSEYRELWQWSVDDIGLFWSAIAEYFGVFPEGAKGPALGSETMPGTQWFPEEHCNFAEYLLRQGDAGDAAVFYESEGRAPGTLTWGELNRQVRTLATALRQGGIQPGDRVVGYLPTAPEALVGLLAATSIGAVWSCCSPDFGTQSVVERFGQLEPKALIAISGYVYNGKVCDRSQQLAGIVEALPTLGMVVHVPYGNARESPSSAWLSWEQLLAAPPTAEFRFERLPFNHPLWVLFTSGTTGLPKGIVHGHGGILLEFLKAGCLHDDLGRGSVKFYYTSTGWTMFNLLIGGLVTGAAVILYDGQPVCPDTGRLWAIAERFGATYFGASPAYIKLMMDRAYEPSAHHDLRGLRTLSLTGSPASVEVFKWIYGHVAADLHLVSISGGTDVAAAFVGGVPILPVYAGEIQAPGLGVAAEAWDERGNRLLDGEGELVITRPIPSMPLYFWNDPGLERYRAAYFEMYPGKWRQGDLISFAPDRMGCVISGRSDSTLNRQGIRIGTAEIYRVVEAIDGIEDSLVLHLEQASGWMPLFVVLREGYQLDGDMKNRINSELARACSSRHVPDEIIPVSAIPYTLSGKKLEVPVKKILLGVPLEKAVNMGAVANPDAVKRFAAFAASRC